MPTSMSTRRWSMNTLTAMMTVTICIRMTRCRWESTATHITMKPCGMSTRTCLTRITCTVTER